LHKAEGNPLFLEEVIRALVSMGAITREAGTELWKATAQIEDIRIPDTLQGVIMARIDRLEEEVKQLLRLASVIGRTFLYRVLQAIAEADRELDHHLDELQRVELIREKSRIPELEYIFKHALIQEATYESILLKRRRELHAQVGACLETLFADRLEEFYGLLTYHYARAENWEKAQEYLFQAGDQASRLAADAEALEHYRQAEAAYTRAFGARWDPLQRATLERKIGEALFRRGEHQQALACLQRALAYLGKPLPTSHWGLRLAILLEAARQIGHRFLPGRLLKPASEPISPAVEEENHLYDVMAWIDVFSNPERFLLLCLRGLNVCERNGISFRVAGWGSGFGVICDFIPVYWLAQGYHRRAIALAKKLQDPYAIGTAYAAFAVNRTFLGEWDTVMELSQQAAQKYWDIGDLHRWGFPVFQTSLAWAYRGALSRALLHCQNLVRLGEEGADAQVQCWGLSMQGFVQQRLGQFEEAIAALQQAAELARTVPDYAFCISANADIGRCYLRQGRLTQALAALEVSRGYYAKNLGGDSYASLRNGLAEAYLIATEQRDKTERADWLKKAGGACREALKQEKEFRPGLPEAMRLQGTYEWLRDKPAPAWKWWQRSLSLSEEMGQCYDVGMTHLEMGQRLGERAHLERAEAIFAEIGAQFDLARVQEALERKEIS